MNEPRWIPMTLVRYLHETAIQVGGGASGIRNLDLLQSALDRPRNQYAYGESDLFHLAAGYAEAIVQNHAFIDGNKRTALTTAISFLALNGHEMRDEEASEHADLMVNLATRQIKRDDVADHFRRYSDPIT